MHMQKKTKQNKKKTNRVYNYFMIGFLFIFIMVVLGLNMYYNSEPEDKTVYCTFEKMITEDVLPRYEHLNMKITAPIMINLSQFDRLNITYQCSENKGILVYPETQFAYLSRYPLKLFSNDTNIEGDVCVAYYIDYYTNDTEKVTQYEDLFMQDIYYDYEKLEEDFDNCGGK